MSECLQVMLLEKRFKVNTANPLFLNQKPCILRAPVKNKEDLLPIKWVKLAVHNAGSMQVKTLRRKYSSSRNP